MAAPRGVRFGVIRRALERGGFWQFFHRQRLLDSRPFSLFAEIRRRYPTFNRAEVTWIYGKGRRSSDAVQRLRAIPRDERLLLTDVPQIGIDPTFPSRFERVRTHVRVRYRPVEGGADRYLNLHIHFRDPPSINELEAEIDRVLRERDQGLDSVPGTEGIDLEDVAEWNVEGVIRRH